MDKDFFKVKHLDQVFEHMALFARIDGEPVELSEAEGRILAQDIQSDIDLPGFRRSTVDGYALRASTTFGASEGNPAFAVIRGEVAMGGIPDRPIGAGEACKMPTGGMLPEGADAVAMVEHIALLDDTTLEIYRSVAPGQHVIERDEDFRRNQTVLNRGRIIRPQEMGLLAAFGRETVTVYKRPAVAIISTGDEIVSIDRSPEPGQIRDMNSYTLAGLIRRAGGLPVPYGIVPDDFESLLETCRQALEQTDMVLISGGSSVGARDFTVEVLSSLPEADILVHGISISPGKPTILARLGAKAFWGLPGHVVSAMVVFDVVVRPFLHHIGGLDADPAAARRIPARLSRSISSAQGRADFVRVRLREHDGARWAEPILGKSGLIHTMIQADGLIEVGINTEGLDRGAVVDVKLF